MVITTQTNNALAILIIYDATVGYRKLRLRDTVSVALLRCPTERITKLVKDYLVDTRKEKICVCTLFVGG